MIDFKELMEKVGQAVNTGYPFVIYRKPDESIIHGMFQKDKRLELVSNFESSGFVMAPFKKSDKAVLISKNNAQLFSCTYENIKKVAPSNNDSHLYQEETCQDKEAHIKLVKKGKNFIVDQKAMKVVLSRKELVPLSEFDSMSVFQKLLSRYDSAFVYIWFHPDIGLWAGASPETLLRTRGPVFRTMALAGTKKFEGKTDVSWDDKELKEQQLVTDHIVEVLEGSNFVVGQTYTKKAGNLLHICTDIGGKLDTDDSITGLIEKLHPTAAVCGFPKSEAENFILSHEGYERSFYTGFLGELNFTGTKKLPNKMDGRTSLESNLFVNLRCMQIIKEPGYQSILYVGGGITADSEPESEWQETVEKSRVMRSVIRELN